MTDHEKNLILVTNRMQAMAIGDAWDAEVLCDALDGMLDDLQRDDFFGTEGQLDPRGDFRDGSWSMDHIQE